MGRQKLLEAIDGRTLIARALDATDGWPRVVVASDAVAAAVGDRAPVVPNNEPERGMVRSLALGSAAIDPAEPIAIVLGDLPDLDAATIARVIAAYDDDIDVVVPRAGDRPGHPVIFGPRARAKIGMLPEGDNQQALRDDPALRRRVVALDDTRAFDDVDTEDELAARRARR